MDLPSGAREERGVIVQSSVCVYQDTLLFEGAVHSIVGFVPRSGSNLSILAYNPSTLCATKSLFCLMAALDPLQSR